VGTTPLSASIHRIRVSSPSLLRLSLRPAALGEVRIELSVRGSAVKARVRTETGEARTLILDRLDELREILEGQGLKVGEFRVDVSDAKTEDDIDAVSGRRGAEEVREGGPRSHRRQVLDVRA
jgi:flagellar hook-length control protein FliK